MMAKLMSCCEVRQDDDQRKSIVQQDMQQSTFFLRRVIEGQGGIALSYVGPHCHRYPRGDSIWWVLTEHTNKSATGGARHAAASTT